MGIGITTTTTTNIKHGASRSSAAARLPECRQAGPLRLKLAVALQPRFRKGGGGGVEEGCHLHGGQLQRFALGQLREETIPQLLQLTCSAKA